MTSRKPKKQGSERLNLASGFLVTARGRGITIMTIGKDYDKLFVSLADKTSAQERKDIAKVFRLLVVHANPSAVYYALADLKKSFIARIAEKMTELASEDQGK